MKVIRLEAENTKRIKAIEILPGENGNVVTLQGRNGAGKSSVIDSIYWALTGKVPEGIVQDGQDRATITVDLGDYTVKKTIPKSGPATLTVKAATGANIASPQKFLDGLIGSLSFDPLAFMNMPPREQRKMIMEISGLETDALDAAKKTALEGLRDAKLKMKLTAKAGDDWIAKNGRPLPKKAPDRAEIVGKLENVRLASKEKTQMQNRLEVWASKLNAKAEEVARIQGLLDAATEAHTTARGEFEGILAKAETWDKDHPGISELTSSLEAQLESVKADESGFEHFNECMAAIHESEESEKAVKKIEEQKRKAVLAAKMPVVGLEVTEDGVTYEGRPLTALSSAESLKVGLAMAQALNPDIRVIRMKDGALLDSENLEIVKAMVKGLDYQIWIERVSDDAEIKVVIEEGGK